jgi:hypothetical protein
LNNTFHGFQCDVSREAITNQNIRFTGQQLIGFKITNIVDEGTVSAIRQHRECCQAFCLFFTNVQ